MIVKGKRAHRFFAYGGAHAVLLAMAFQIEGREGWLIALPLMAVVSLYAWVTTLRRHRVVGDMPTSLVASAAQGYIELYGVAENHPDAKILAQLSKRECCWFRYEIEERDNERNWRTLDEGESAASFLLRDSSGRCTVDPEGAEILCANKRSWEEGDTRYTEWWIEEGDPLYALGEFRTRNFASDAPSVDLLMQPEDGRVFIISNEAPERVKNRFGWWAWAHLGILFGALTTLVFVFF